MRHGVLQVLLHLILGLRKLKNDKNKNFVRNLTTNFSNFFHFHHQSPKFLICNNYQDILSPPFEIFMPPWTAHPHWSQLLQIHLESSSMGEHRWSPSERSQRISPGAASHHTWKFWWQSRRKGGVQERGGVLFGSECVQPVSNWLERRQSCIKRSTFRFYATWHASAAGWFMAYR